MNGCTLIIEANFPETSFTRTHLQKCVKISNAGLNSHAHFSTLRSKGQFNVYMLLDLFPSSRPQRHTMRNKGETSKTPKIRCFVNHTLERISFLTRYRSVHMSSRDEVADTDMWTPPS